MSNWPITAASRCETLGAATGAGTTVTAGGPELFGAAVTLGTTSFAAAGMLLMMSAQSQERYLIDILVNTGGSDQILVENWLLDATWSTGFWPTVSVPLPVAIPLGATLKAKCRSTLGFSTVTILIVTHASDFPGAPGGSQVRSLTDYAGSEVDPEHFVFQTGNTPTAWTTICAASVKRVSRLWATVSGHGDIGRTPTDFLVDLAVGGVGAEKPIASFLGRQTATGAGGTVWTVPCDIPAASRLAFRVTCADNTANDNTVVSALGLVA